MRKLLLIIKREYLTRVKTKGFIIGTVIVPLLGLGSILLVVFLVGHSSAQSMHLVIVDDNGSLAQNIAKSLDGKFPNGQPQFVVEKVISNPASPDSIQTDLRAQINSQKLDAYLWIPKDLSKSFELHMRNPDNFSLNAPLTDAVNQAVVAQRLADRQVKVNDIKDILKTPDIELLKVSETGESVEKGQGIAIAIALVVLLYTALIMYGVITMRSVIEEKSTRTMEVLISSVSPMQLLGGKILGVAAVAFTQFLIWMGSTAIFFSFGVLSSWGMTKNSSLANVHVPVSLIVYAIVFFLGGYFLYSAMFAAIGSACSNEQDAQQLQWLAMGPLVFCMLIYSVILTDPTSRTAIILSEIPFFSPVLMSLRISLQTPPIWQLALSFVLLALTTVVVIYASAKIYRIGVLMYGKRPSVVEMVRWLRYT
ncbi:MAG TPA: ABC transporter permease [Candidatus Acidoferrales bacterium]|nr:ABC transporter permease [Candidatus Acidoferrales bacterium]